MPTRDCARPEFPGGYAASVALTLGANPRATSRGPGGGARQRTVDRAGRGHRPRLPHRSPSPPRPSPPSRTTSPPQAPPASRATRSPAVTVPAAPPGDPLAAATWEEARTALAARLTARLAAAAGATVAEFAAPERNRLTPPPTRCPDPERPPVAASRHPADSGGPESPHPFGRSGPRGPDAEPRRRETGRRRRPSPSRGGTRSCLPWPGPSRAGPLRVDPAIIARHVPGNPAYAVRYAHARAASGVRWAAASSAADTIGSGEAPQPLPADPAERLVPAAGADTMAVCAIGPGRRDIGGYGGRSPGRRQHCLTRCRGSRNGSPPPRAVAGPTSSPATWRIWPASPLTS